jgi:hypothetical protein
VLHILQSDFEHIKNLDCYRTVFSEKLGRECVVYEQYPDMLHFHTEPGRIEAEHQKLLRRIARLQKVLSHHGSLVNFIYYRNFCELQEGEQRVTLKGAVNLLETEVSDFVKFFRASYPEKEFFLTLIMQFPIELMHQCETAVNAAVRSNKLKEVSYRYTIVRPDSDRYLKALWRSQWCKIVLDCKGLTMRQKLKIWLRLAQECLYRKLYRCT